MQTDDILAFTSTELWALHHFLFQLCDIEDRPFMREVAFGIIALEADKTRVNFPLLVNEEDAWAMVKLIPMAYMVGNEFVGRNILLKAMQVLCKNGENDASSTSSGADNRADDYARA